MSEITDFGPRKTIFILAIVVGCFAVLWPKIFYPMLTASVNSHHSTSDACCEVLFESDVTALDIMQEMCQNILRHHQIDPRLRDAFKTSKMAPQIANLCREEVLARCGIDLSTFLAEKERLGKTYKQVLEEIRTFNSSLCLKVNFGISLSQLGTPHLIRYHILMPHSTIRQERRTPPHAGGLHPALRERGRTIPSSHIVPKIVDRPDHVMPKKRPPMGGAGHVVPAPKGNGTMGVIMPLYTLGIVLFFLYTIVKVLKKNSDSEIISEYPGAAAEKEFQKMVFNPDLFASAMTGGTMHYQKEHSPYKPAPTIEELNNQAAGDIEIDQLRRRLDETEAAMERIVVQMGNISRSVMHSPSSQPEIKEDSTVQDSYSKEDQEVESIEQSPTVKVMGMEMTASCEGGQKCSRPTTPIIPPLSSHTEREKTPPVPIYLEGALPPQCELLVTDSETQEQKAEDDAEAPVILSGKMTLSLISLDQIEAESGDENEMMEEEESTSAVKMNRNKREADPQEITSSEKELNGLQKETHLRVYSLDSSNVKIGGREEGKKEIVQVEEEEDEEEEEVEEEELEEEEEEEEAEEVEEDEEEAEEVEEEEEEAEEVEEDEEEAEEVEEDGEEAEEVEEVEVKQKKEVEEDEEEEEEEEEDEDEDDEEGEEEEDEEEEDEEEEDEEEEDEQVI